MAVFQLVAVVCLLLVLLVYRLQSLKPSRNPAKPPKRAPGETCSLGVFMGSGGHTAEMMTLLSSLPLERYSPRTYLFCHGDHLSPSLVEAFEAAWRSSTGAKHVHRMVPLPRARQVGQSWSSSVWTTLRTLRVALQEVVFMPLLRRPMTPWVDVLLVNGPGTCVVLVACCWIRRVLGLSYTRIIYVESFARVSSLSLSARLLQLWVDRFVVQWPDLVPSSGDDLDSRHGQKGRQEGHIDPGAKRRGNVEYRGWLV